MKKIIFPAIAFILFYCVIINKPCNISDYFSYSENKEAVINHLEEKEYFSGTKNNDLFFNLSFGMSTSEVEQEFKKLQRENILDNIDSQYGILAASYTMKYHEFSNLGRVYCFFNENKLHELQIDSLNQNGSNLLDLFMKKYGECSYLAENNESNEYHWIHGNQHVTIYFFYNSDRLLIQYLDTTEKIKEKNIRLLDRWCRNNIS
jgi:hypothetical protein